MKMTRLFAVTTVGLMLAGCQAKDGAADPAAEAAKKPVATINGKAITKGEFDAFVKQVAGRAVTELDAEQKTRALDSLINLRVLAAQAEKDGLHKQPDLAAELELADACERVNRNEGRLVVVECMIPEARELAPATGGAGPVG